MADKHPINITVTQGFDTFDNFGSYSLGSEASVHFTAPAPSEDMTLEIVAAACHVSRRLPAQTVSITVNGHAVGECAWTSTEPSRRELVVPSAFLGGGEVWLRFHFADPVSPFELGLDRETRRFGLRVSSLRFRPRTPVVAAK